MRQKERHEGGREWQGPDRPSRGRHLASLPIRQDTFDNKVKSDEVVNKFKNHESKSRKDCVSMVLDTGPRRLFRLRYAQLSRQSIQQSEKVCCRFTRACQPWQDPRDAWPCSSPATSRSPYPQLDETEEASLQADSRVQDIRVPSTPLAQEIREEFGNVAEA